MYLPLMTIPFTITHLADGFIQVTYTTRIVLLNNDQGHNSRWLRFPAQILKPQPYKRNKDLDSNNDLIMQVQHVDNPLR